MKVLVVGSGGREHALAWRLAQSESVTEVIAAPGNPGIAGVARCIPVADLSPTTLLACAGEFSVDLTVVGPEAPLVAGVADAFRAAGRKVVGPTRSQARLEGSKIFAKAFFTEHRIPTASFHSVDNFADARRVLAESRFPIVLKADGLAAGKGVVIATDRTEAEHALTALGPQLVIEEFLAGEEVSFIALSDGRDVLALEPCQDHKAAFDGDRGPNTGGMGAYCDSRILDEATRERVLNEIIRPTVGATGYTGFLYAGLMMTEDGPKLLEFNVRLGDPEAQPLCHRMVVDLGRILLASAESRLGAEKFEWRPEPSVCVVLASEGYPGAVRSGVPIRGVEEAESTGAVVFQAGTQCGNSGLETASGRVLGVTARGADLGQAIQNVYTAVDRVSFAGMQFRRDIGRKGLARWDFRSGTYRRYNTPLQ